jgi:hypothetical protein
MHIKHNEHHKVHRVKVRELNVVENTTVTSSKAIVFTLAAIIIVPSVLSSAKICRSKFRNIVPTGTSTIRSSTFFPSYNDQNYEHLQMCKQFFVTSKPIDSTLDAQHLCGRTNVEKALHLQKHKAVQA